jgi:hypothetical protein
METLSMQASLLARACEHNAVAPLRPTGIYSAFDYIKVWMPRARPLSRSEIEWLHQHCRKVRIKRAPGTHPNAGLRQRQRLQLYQPHRTALQFLAQIKGCHLNYAEVSLDWIFASEQELTAAVAFLRQHVVKKHQRGTLRFYPPLDQATATDAQLRRAALTVFDFEHEHVLAQVRNGERSDVDEHLRQIAERRTIVARTLNPQPPTCYTNRRRKSATVSRVDYHDLPSKVTGEVHCLHIEWRMSGARSLARAGIASVADLLALDHRQFWRQRLHLYDIDRNKLGRMLNNWQRGSRRKGKWLANGLDHDRVLAALTLNVCGSVQALLHAYRHHLDLRTCLHPMDIDELLPSVEGDDTSLSDRR